MSVPPATLRRIMRELSDLRKGPPEGIRVVTDEDNMLDLIGIIEGPEGTPYAGGYFRVKFKFTEEFPASPPKCTMITKIFHPNVSSAGEICVNTLKKDWQSHYGISHILVTIKCLLIYPNPESALDEEAGKLLLENYDSYYSRAKLITSVHATPKVKPVEFNTPSSSSSTTATPGATSSSSSSKPVPNSASKSIAASSSKPDALTSLTTSDSTLITPIPYIAPSPRKPSNSIPPPPLKSAPASAITERSLKPLSTADNNVASGNGKMTTEVGATVMSNTHAVPNKAVKRAATGTAVSGAEKRKKALKRL